MKLLYKLISVVLITAVVSINCCSVSYSGVIDDEPEYIPPPGVAVSPKKMVVEKPAALPEAPEAAEASTAEQMLEIDKTMQTEQPQSAETQEPQEVTTPAPSIETPSAPGLLSRVMAALVKTIFLIIALTGMYVLYKKFIGLKGQGKMQGKLAEEPKTVGEAVSSYVKHKLN